MNEWRMENGKREKREKSNVFTSVFYCWIWREKKQHCLCLFLFKYRSIEFDFLIFRFPSHFPLLSSFHPTKRRQQINIPIAFSFSFSFRIDWFVVNSMLSVSYFYRFIGKREKTNRKPVLPKQRIEVVRVKYRHIGHNIMFNAQWLSVGNVCMSCKYFFHWFRLSDDW